MIHPGVEIEEPCSIAPFVIVGELPRGSKPGELTTIIAKNSVIRSHSVIYAGNKIGHSFQTGHHVLIRENNLIGDNVSIGSNTVIEHHVKIANNVRIHSQAFIPEYTVIEDGVWVGPNVVITNARYPNTPTTKNELLGVTLEKGCMIGANVTILPGITVGKNSLIGAGSVVTKDVPANAVMVGNPAKPRGSISDINQYAFLHT